MFLTRNVMMKYRDQTNGEGEGGGGSGETEAEKAAAEATAKAEAAAEAERKAEEERRKSGISDSEAKLLKEVMEKKNALKVANEEAAKAKEALKAFDGIDPVKVRELLKAQKDAETLALEAKGEWTRLKDQMAEEHKKDRSTLETQVNETTEANKKLHAQIAELTVGQAFATSQFIANELALTVSKSRVVYGSHFEFVDGAVVGYDKPVGSANRTQLVDSAGEPLAFDAAIAKIIDADPEKDSLLKSKMKGGSGSRTNQRTEIMRNKEEPGKGASRIAAALTKSPLTKR